MLYIRKAEERGHADHGWLDSHHTFSFAGYYDPNFMGFGVLRVINDDRVAGGGGFGTHPHRDMEIISYVVSGALEHRDSMGTGSVIRPGDVQRMTAGTGVTHSEYNHSKTEPVRFLQIWIIPESRGLSPGYEQKSFAAERHDKLQLVASRDGRDGSITVHQDLQLYASMLAAGASVNYELAADRQAWLQVVEGQLNLNGHALKEGDGVALVDEAQLQISASESANFLLFDMEKLN